MLVKLVINVLRSVPTNLHSTLLQLDLALKDEKGGDISSFITNGEWDLIGKQHNKKNLDQGR